MRQITESQLGQGDYAQKHSIYFLRLPKDHTFDDLFNPRYWAQLQKQGRLREHDIIRVQAYDKSFDMFLTVMSMVPGAVNVSVWPRMPANVADFAKPRPVSVGPMDHLGKSIIRVEQAGGRFRVLGLDNQEISGHPTEQEAEGAMAAYMGQVRMREPTPEESSAHAAEQAEIKVKRDAEIEEKRALLEEKRERAKALARGRRVA
jgi:hypothetical protein